jgi:hypothetical protein
MRRPTTSVPFVQQPVRCRVAGGRLSRRIEIVSIRRSPLLLSALVLLVLI